MRPDVSPRRVLIARAIALTADLLQIGLLPLIGGRIMSPVDEILDLAIAATLIWLIGWHVAFLPTLMVELLPVADVFPTWTVAVFFVTRGGAGDLPKKQSGHNT